MENIDETIFTKDFEVESYVEYRMRFLRMHVKVAKQAKQNGWTDLYDWSIKSAEKIIKELEDV